MVPNTFVQLKCKSGWIKVSSSWLKFFSGCLKCTFNLRKFQIKIFLGKALGLSHWNRCSPLPTPTHSSAMWKPRILILTSQLPPTYYFSSPPTNFLENLPYHPQTNNVILQIRTSLHAKIQQFLNNSNFGLSFQICRPL